MAGFIGLARSGNDHGLRLDTYYSVRTSFSTTYARLKVKGPVFTSPSFSNKLLAI